LIPNLEKGNGIILAPLPIYHIFAFTVNMGFVAVGCQAILIPNPKDLPSLIKEWKKYNPCGIIGINTLFNALVNNKEF